MTPEQEEIARLIKRLAPDRSPARKGLDGDTAVVGEFWSRLVEVGLPGIALPDEWGGGNFGLAEQATAMESLGHAAAIGPYLSAFLATPVLKAGNTEARALAEELVAGRARVGVCLSAESGAPQLRIETQGTDARISGDIPDALEASELDVLLVPADGKWWAVKRSDAGVSLTPTAAIDGAHTQSKLKLESVPAKLVSTLPVERIVAVAWTLLAAECVGLAQAALDMARGYAIERKQFGQPIGRFQATKHKLTDGLVALEGARSAVHGAAQSAVDGIPDARIARVAKATATSAAVKVIGDAIQLHGAMGNTWEFDLHLLYRRAKTDELLLGEPDYHTEVLAGELLAEGVGEKAGEKGSQAKQFSANALAEMKLEPEDKDFIAEFRAWLDKNATPEMRESVRVRVPAERRRALRAWQARMADAGWVGIHWPKEYNGRAATFTQQVLYHTEIAFRNLPRLIGNRGLSQAGPTIIAHGTPAQKAKYLEATRRADILWASGFSERGSGSDLASLRTRGRVDGNELVITGHKIWTTSAHFADCIYVLVRTGPLVPKHGGISCVVVPTNAPGVTISPIRRMTGIADFNECFFDDVRVPLENIIGPMNEGWRVMRTTLSHEHMTNFLGTQFKMAGTVERIIERLRKHEASGAPVSYGLRRRVAQAWINSQILRLHGMRNIVNLAAGHDPGPEGSILKVFGQEEEKRIWELAVDVLGPRGLARDMWTTGFLSARGATVGGGTSEIHRNKVAERVLGMPRDLWADDSEGEAADSGD